MPFVVPCPSCQARLKLPDHLKGSGKSVKCPKCSAPVKVPDEAEGLSEAVQAQKPSPPPARREPAEEPARARKRPREDDDDDDEDEDDEEEERPRGRKRARDEEESDEDDEEEDDEDEDEEEDDDDRPRRKRKRPEQPLPARDWKNCRWGVLLVYVSACLVLGAICLAELSLLLFFLLAWLGAGIGTLQTIGQVIEVFTEVLLVGAFFSHLVGLVFCCLAPPRNSAAVFAIVSASLAGIGLLLGVVGYFSASLPVRIIGMLVMVAQQIVFLFFLRALALTLKDRDTAASCRNLAIAYGVSLVAYPLLVYVVVRITAAVSIGAILSGASIRPDLFALGVTIPIILVLAFGVGLYLALFMWFMMNLTKVYDGINYEMGRGRRNEVAVWIPLLGTAVFLCVVYFIIGLVAFMSMDAPRQQPPPDMRFRQQLRVLISN